MKNSAIICIVLLTISMSCSMTPEEQTVANDLSEMNLNGRVKSIKEICYKAVDSFGTITMGEPKREHDFVLDFIVFFNYDGNKIAKSEYEAGEKLVSRREYFYDENGLLFEDNEYGFDGKLNRKINYQYNEAGFPVQDTWTTYRLDLGISMGMLDYTSQGGASSLVTLYKSDDLGRRTEQTVIIFGEVDSRFKYEYNISGNLALMSSLNADGEIKYLETYLYNHRGEKIEKKKYKGKDIVEFTNTYQYNDKGDLSEQSLRNPEKQLHEVRKYEYEYDSQGNWLVKLEYINNIPQYIYKRGIEYF